MIISQDELISAGRRELVDFEDQAMVTAGGNVNQRMHIKVRDENGKVTEEGFFTPTVIADPEKDAREILVRLSKKYGPNYGRLLQKLYDTDLSKYFKDTFMAWDRADPFASMEQKDAKAAIEYLNNNWLFCFYNRMELNKEANEVKNALDPEHVKLEIEGIMNTPGWRKLAKLPEDRLRSMAAERNAPVNPKAGK